MSAPGLQGLRPWMVQRITAAYIALYVVYFFVNLLVMGGMSSYQAWATWFAWPGNNIATGLLLIALVWHAWIGVRDVILDYIGQVVTRIILLTLVVVVLLGSLLWGLKVLMMVVVL